MSTQCNRFVQNAWKKDLCSNCFKPKEEHTSGPDATLRINVGKASSNLKIDSKVQGILRGRQLTRDQKKKNVAFPDSLTEVIGYGGDDFYSDEDPEEEEESLDNSLTSEEDIVPDSEEERALGNLTRANTNFNTVTANLSAVDDTDESSKSLTSTPAPKSFASLMLGRVQKDSEGKKTTLLVSVTPFGGDEAVPTAKRPNDRKINVNGYSGPAKKPGDGAGAESKPEVILKSMKTFDADSKKDDKQDDPPGLEKIVDMPLITSNNLISVIQRSESLISNGSIDKESESKQSDKKIGAITRYPAMKKTENEKPKVVVQSTLSRVDYNFVGQAKPETKVNATRKGTALSSFSSPEEAAVSDRALIVQSKDVNKITIIATESKKTEKENQSPLETRKVEGEASSDTVESKKYTFEESRELAGEPDGKADDEDVSEPPALPKSPPPIDTRSAIQNEIMKVPIITAEPRVSFLHGGGSSESKSKPLVPQKPISYPVKLSLAKNIVDKNGIFKKPASGYVLPPPSVQNASTRPGRLTNSALADQVALPSKEKAEESSSVLSSSKNNSSIDRFDHRAIEKESTQSGPGQQYEQETKLVSEKVPPAGTKTKPSLLNLQRDHSIDGGDAGSNLETEEDAIESQPGIALESIRSQNKRRMAPRPPATEAPEESAPPSSLFARNPGANLKSDSPVVREKEKRERASSCSPKFRKTVCDVPDPSASQPTEPAPRRNISLSQDSLANNQEIREEKKRGRSKFSLKRFLRMGSRKDIDMTGHSSKADEIASGSQMKPRLEIIHPLELEGAVEVVGGDRIAKVSEDQTDSCKDSAKSGSPPGSLQSPAARPGKPPPPPRNQSLEDWSRLDPANKPARPPPPRVDTKLPPRSEKSSSASWQPPSAPSATSDSIYANLAAEDVTGEVRSGLAPSKPQRTASMRDQGAAHPLVKKNTSLESKQDYEAIGSAPPTSDSPTSTSSHVYERLSSSPECDSNPELRHNDGSHLPCKRKSDSSAMDASSEFKFHYQPFVRSTSLPYCGSETESELYAPYSFYTGDEGPEADQGWKNKGDEQRMSRLRQRRGRSIVHRSLEDNYGAVVVANHEALAQFAEQLNQISQIPTSLRGLKTANPRLSDFNLDTNSFVSAGKRIFCAATWNEQSVTLCVAFDLTAHVSRKDFYLAPIIEFIDVATSEIADKARLLSTRDARATISVLPQLQISTIHTFGNSIKDKSEDGATRDASFVLLQYVNALKSLQARGIEESPRNLSNVILCREDKNSCYRLQLLQGLTADDDSVDEKASLCQCALTALRQLSLGAKLPLIQELLVREKAVALSQVKSILEFSLWGPADLTLGDPREREVILQRWLDLERATVLHALVRMRSPLSVTDEFQLFFLVRTSAKIMCEASLLLDEQKTRLARYS